MSSGPHSKAHSGSLLRRLQLSYAMATLLVVGLMAVFMDAALHRSLEAEDAVVMTAQADALVHRISNGLTPEGDRERRPEKAEWRTLDSTGRILDQSAGMDTIPALPWPTTADAPIEVKSDRGAIYSILVRPMPHGALQLVMDRTHEASLVAGFRRTLAIAIGLATLLAATLGRWVAKRGLRPLRLMTQEAGNIDPQRLDRRLYHEHFPEELNELVETLNGTLARLQEAFDRLSRMASELAHELRTPLQNVRAEVEALLLRPKDEATSREALGSVLEECDRLARLIEQMLFLARSENPAVAIQKKPLVVLELLQDVADFFEAQAEESSVTLRVEGAPGFMLTGDRALLERALHNLAANALRQAPPKTEVVLGCESAPTGIRFFVRDAGMGFSPEILARLGEPWTRGPKAKGPGFGLGLAIVKGIAQLHVGTLSAENLPQGGAEVSLRLPA